MLFGEAISFNEPLNWDTKNVINMSYMFYNAISFNQPLNFNTENVNKMSHMFQLAKSFNQSLNFTSTKNVTDMRCMFLKCPISEESKCILYHNYYIKIMMKKRKTKSV